MKKLVLTILAASCLSFSAFSQGSIYITTGALSDNGGVTTHDALATDVNNATTWFSGNLSVQLWYAAAGTISGGQLNTINSYNNVVNGAPTAIGLLGTDGFTQVASTFANSSFGSFTVTNSASGQVNLPTVPTGTSAFFALVLTDTSTSDGMTGWQGVLAFANNTGGNYQAIPPGLPTNLTGWDNLGVNLVLSQVPEPTTLALAGLGGLSLLLFRRRK